MRIRHILMTGIALTTLFGCGTNNNESMPNGNWDNVENVRNHPDGSMHYNDGTFNGQGTRDGGRDGAWEGNQQDPNLNGRPFGQNGVTNNIDRGNNGNNQGMNQGNQQSNQNGDFLERGRVGDRNNQDDYRVSEKLADRITSRVDEIDNAYVLTTGNNAYVACHLDNDGGNGRTNDLSDKLEREVTRAVKDADNQIENVFVSSNPDFVDLTSNYMRDVDNGEPIEGFVDQFSEMIERIFPTRNR